MGTPIVDAILKDSVVAKGTPIVDGILNRKRDEFLKEATQAPLIDIKVPESPTFRPIDRLSPTSQTITDIRGRLSGQLDEITQQEPTGTLSPEDIDIGQIGIPSPLDSRIPIPALDEPSISAFPGEESPLGRPDLFREDGTRKGRGFKGNVGTREQPISELSATVGLIVNGEDKLVPLIVSTSTKKEIDTIINTPIEEMPQSIIDKAFDHAKKRIEKGKSPFFNQRDDTIKGRIGKTIEDILPNFGTFFPGVAEKDKTTFMKAVDIAKPSLTLLTSGLTISTQLVLAIINDLKGKGSRKNIEAITRILTLNTQEGDEVFVADILKALGITDKRLKLPEGTIDRTGFVGDWIAFGKLGQFFKQLLASKDPLKTFKKEAVTRATADAEITSKATAVKAAQGLKQLEEVRAGTKQFKSGRAATAEQIRLETDRANFIRVIANTVDDDNDLIKILREQVALQDAEIANIVEELVPKIVTTRSAKESKKLGIFPSTTSIESQGFEAFKKTTRVTNSDIARINKKLEGIAIKTENFDDLGNWLVKIDGKLYAIFKDDNAGFTQWFEATNLSQQIGFTKKEAIETLKRISSGGVKPPKFGGVKIESQLFRDVQKKTIRDATKRFGITKNPLDTGYVMSDGKMLDLRRSQGTASLEHLTVDQIAGIKGTTAFESIANFQLKTGAVRVSPSEGVLTMSITAGQDVSDSTWRQLSRMAKELNTGGDGILIEVLDTSGRSIVSGSGATGIISVGKAKQFVEDAFKKPKKSRVKKLRDLAIATGTAGAALVVGDKEAEAGIISTIGKVARQAGKQAKKVVPIAKKVDTDAFGRPIEKGVKQTKQAKEAEIFAKGIERQRESSEARRNVTVKKVKKVLNRSIVDVKGTTKRQLTLLAKTSPEAREAVEALDVVAGSHSKAILDANAAEALVYSGLSKAKRKNFDEFINAKRTLEIKRNKGEKFKVAKELENAQAYLDEMPAALKAELEPRAKEYWNTFKTLTNMMEAEGLLTREARIGLQKQGRNFSPRKVLDWFDPELAFTFGESRIIKVGSSGLKPLAGGTVRDIEVNTSILLREAIERTNTRIFRNRANLALRDLALNVPDNGIVTLSKIIKVTKDKKPIFQKPPVGFERIAVMVKGRPDEMLVSNEFARGWVLRDPILNPTVANILAWTSGSKILKAMATGFNPEFALTNLPRDIAHILMVTDEFSRTLPRGFVQFVNDAFMSIPTATGIRPIRGLKTVKQLVKKKGANVFNKKDLKQILSDTFNREGAYRDYINQGGGMEFMTHQGRFTRKEFGRITKVVPEKVITQLGNLQTYLGYVGETSEIIGRLALRRRAIKNGATPQQATWIARTYLDFSQGGNIVKAVDSAVPYTNAAVQGTRGIFRAARDKPGVFGYKVAQVAGLAVTLYLANKHINPKGLSQVPPHIRAANFIIMTPFSFIDKEGNRKYFYMKIAKDQGQRAVASLFENLFKRMYYKEDFDLEEMKQAINAFAPMKPSDFLPPTFEAALGYMHNTDFFLDKETWRGGKLTRPFKEYTNYTHPAFVKLGQISKDLVGERASLSPERTRVALSQIFTGGNPWTSLVGLAWKEIFKELSQKEQDQVTAELIMSQPFLRRVLSSTDPAEEHRAVLRRVDAETAEDRFEQNRDFDKIDQEFFDKQKKNPKLSAKTDPAIQAFKKGLSKTDIKRLSERHNRRGKIQKLTNRRMWFMVLGIDTAEGRARGFWNVWRMAGAEERKKLAKDANTVPGLVTKRFVAKFNALKKLTLQEERNK